jgi:hypothetical protein
MQVKKENRGFMYKQDSGPRFQAYLNIEGKQYKVAWFAEVGNDDTIYYAGPVTENTDEEQGEDK